MGALWEYRETYRLGRSEPETVANAHRRLSVIVKRLCGPALPTCDPIAPVAETKSQTAPVPFRVD
jgi:hypothetical protein